MVPAYGRRRREVNLREGADRDSYTLTPLLQEGTEGSVPLEIHGDQAEPGL